MSEYQHYEWQTIDRPLTPAERAAVGKLSSHIEVSATHAWVDYEWGDFKHDPEQVLARYFDAFLYFANWGQQSLAFRLPKNLIDAEAMRPYETTECIALKPAGDFYILSFSVPEQEPRDWDEMEGDLAMLAALRSDILQGDLRALYLGWLLGADASAFPYEEDEEPEDDFAGDAEPPVPPGLGQLSPALEEFVRFMGLDPFLVQAAAQASPPLQATPTAAIADAIPQLPRAECDALLRRLLDGEANLQAVLTRRLQEMAGTGGPPAPAAGCRTLGDLRNAAEQLERAAAKRAKAAAEAKRIQELQSFALQAEHAWRTVAEEIERKNASGYDRAVALLVRLRELAVFQDNLPAFQARLTTLLSRHSTRRGLLERVEKAKLL